ncbi:MAG: hypothetical protein WBM48_13320, partial [Polyangiales bacterium]
MSGVERRVGPGRAELGEAARTWSGLAGVEVHTCAVVRVPADVEHLDVVLVRIIGPAPDDVGPAGSVRFVATQSVEDRLARALLGADHGEPGAGVGTKPASSIARRTADSGGAS